MIENMICMIARLDEAARERLMELEQVVQTLNLTPRQLYGHITMATYVGRDEEQFLHCGRELVRGRKKFSVTYRQIEVMAATWTLAVTPYREGTLAAVQGMIARKCQQGLDRWTRAGIWKPHTTLLNLPHGDIYGVAAAIREKFQPFSAEVRQIEFSRVEESGYRILDAVELL